MAAKTLTETIRVSSPDFAEGGRIPKRNASAPEGENVPPALSWSNVPPGAKELALVCDDPDAPSPEPWVHWVVYGIPASAAGLPLAAKGAVLGLSSWKAAGWGGPLPPEGDGTHHYRFTVYALDERLSLPPGTTKAHLLEAMERHVLAQGTLVGTYSR